MSQKNDPYYIQKLVLLPFTQNYSKNEIDKRLNNLPKRDKNTLMYHVFRNNLGPLWIEKFGKQYIEKMWSEAIAHKLKSHYRQITILYIQQLIAIRKTTKLFDEHSIPHALFKGTHTREFVYGAPASRYCEDIDILIREEEKDNAIRLLEENGYKLYENTKNISHEASLTKNQASIDLHWHIMRPGRIPESLTEELLAKRQWQDGYWSLNIDDNIFVLLTHSVFAKYLETTRSGLIRMCDLIFWIQTKLVDWEKIYHLLHKTGLLSAAWITLEYLRQLTGVEPPQSFTIKIAPSRAKQWYLRQWINTDRPSAFYKNPMIPKVLFTLLGHDSLVGILQLNRTLLSNKIRVRR